MRASTVVIVIAAIAACGGERAVVATSPAAPSSSAGASVTPSAAPSSSCVDAPPVIATYQPEPSWSGRAANIPEPPTLPVVTMRIADAFTVAGAIRTLHAIDASHALAHDVAIVGYIVDTNLARAPACAIHHVGHATPASCTSEIPTFTIADEKGASAAAPRIRVMGWASNFANVYEAYLKDRAHDATLRLDEIWAREVPIPLPAVGARVKVTGRYGAMFTLASTGITADPRSGVLTATHTEELAPAATPARFPQLPP